MDESVIRHFEQSQVGTLKLSAAMRIGARMRPQGYFRLFNAGRTCALGAACDGVGVRPDYEELENAFPQVYSIRVSNVPGADVPLEEVLLWEAIGFMNDTGSTREAIADWLESKGL